MLFHALAGSDCDASQHIVRYRWCHAVSQLLFSLVPQPLVKNKGGNDPLMCCANQPEKRRYESKFDLDYDNFLTKKIDRCNDCGDVYYTKAARSHACANQRSPSEIPAAMPDGFEIDRLGLILNIRPVVERVWVHDEIYAIWKRSGFPRHSRPEAGPCLAPELILKDTSSKDVLAKDPVSKDTFSFSPYDNFF